MLNKKSTEGLFIPGVAIFVRKSMAHEESIVSTDGKFSFISIYIINLFIINLIYIIYAEKEMHKCILR